MLTAYNSGYKNAPDRKNLFKYNEDVEELLELEDPEKIIFIHNLYRNYKNMYELKIGKSNE